MLRCASVVTEAVRSGAAQGVQPHRGLPRGTADRRFPHVWMSLWTVGFGQEASGG
ncbi:MAG: hypothetical protein AVDCRST_MAG50-2215 [uncultured Acidimicrobiales bacterium]|uniref:Uncharacterized protein n=1 Tax=uncultured Acidimicrobiales bacterium TaxID=310071 RepID=A0A6J4IHX3_9ACTN|nr:MAG: hypothetical protein AVDCRST_MAG50-2215 [uncultured Acidimicrobiales bacterium]